MQGSGAVACTTVEGLRFDAEHGPSVDVQWLDTFSTQLVCGEAGLAGKLDWRGSPLIAKRHLGRGVA